MQNKIKTSRVYVNIIKKYIIRREFIEEKIASKNCIYHLFDTFWKVILLCLERSSLSVFSP